MTVGFRVTPLRPLEYFSVYVNPQKGKTNNSEIFEKARWMFRLKQFFPTGSGLPLRFPCFLLYHIYLRIASPFCKIFIFFLLCYNIHITGPGLTMAIQKIRKKRKSGRFCHRRVMFCRYNGKGSAKNSIIPLQKSGGFVIMKGKNRKKGGRVR